MEYNGIFDNFIETDYRMVNFGIEKLVFFCAE